MANDKGFVIHLTKDSESLSFTAATNQYLLFVTDLSNALRQDMQRYCCVSVSLFSFVP